MFDSHIIITRTESTVNCQYLQSYSCVGVSNNAGCESTQASSASNSPVKVKSLKEIKREKILRARLEYERKKFLASQQDDVAPRVPGKLYGRVKC